MEKDSTERIISLLERYSTREDLDLWRVLLANISEDLAPRFVDFLTIFSNSIPFTNQIMREQKEAYLDNDKDKLERIYKEIDHYLSV